MSVYALKSTINDVTYIGSTTLPLKTRLACHKSKAKVGDSLLYREMRRLGIENFYIEEIERVDDPTLLKKRESEVMRELQTHVTGYNIKLEGRDKKEYYQTFKEHINANRYEVIKCQCGGHSVKAVFSRHKNSRKHLNYIYGSNREP